MDQVGKEVYNVSEEQVLENLRWSKNKRKSYRVRGEPLQWEVKRCGTQKHGETTAGKGCIRY